MKKYYLYENRVVIKCNNKNKLDNNDKIIYELLRGLPVFVNRRIIVKYLDNNCVGLATKNKLIRIPKNKVEDYLMAGEI